MSPSTAKFMVVMMEKVRKMGYQFIGHRGAEASIEIYFYSVRYVGYASWLKNLLYFLLQTNNKQIKVF